MLFIRFLLLFFAIYSPFTVAFEHPAPFKIKAIYVSSPENFHFRVISERPDSWHCHNGPLNPAWSYINNSDPGSKAMMSALLTAYAANKTVTLVTIGVDTDVGRKCKIIEFQIGG
ncbi:conserved exported hypothetical protein [Vibrio chagasii]|uniref:hypothetical protein n=1 Tax=Vibrio TaxID=662 RepID=UPI000CF3D5CC|nr:MULTISPECIES: hypothetical protein [Vibrio]CAH6910417.1 conserved exported hypothetical protein [Vibrio chagasii]NOI94297.1 hypothetical protein [Vibrio sp. T3Y01]PQJ56534.1 hypothetical protein BTO12_02980 [Vibrio splendidus]CAH7136301.1 conserved exported hypothetical protein [Vibrio chagasii]CAH7297407.1 conserved exported hypothetical protein [Vibrio chagasii]